MAGTPQYIRNLNENLIMDALITQGAMSRADISRQTGLSKPTVSSAVEHLIERNLVKETGRADNAQGRKATLIQFNETAYYVCGVDIGATRIRVALADLNGQIVAYAAYPPIIRDMHQEQESQESNESSERSVLLLLQGYVNQMLQKNGLEWSNIRCIGFGIPGVVLPGSGKIRRIVEPLTGMESAFSRDALARAFPCDVILDNDVNLAALGEYRSGAAVDSPLFVFFSIGAGTGAGIMVQGQLLHGLGGMTGEVAEMLLENGSRLEEVLSADGLLHLAKHQGLALGLKNSNELKESNEVKNPNHSDALASNAEEVTGNSIDEVADGMKALTPEMIFEAARSGEVQAMSVIKQYSQMIAAALRQISTVLAPELIVLGGGIGGNGDVLLPILRQIAAEQFPVKPQLICSALGERAVVTGAVQVALQRTLLNLQQGESEE
ncbi:ROK family transcriptional regulator [Paenibacillus silvae]|uniref:ROK family transcriptional regulator n=1 Tax=Paenibacillus silvae TaxID=1325358 RepID=UPI0025A11655|nr:ROK family transcriptional regulator [Paenibacillus silvae]MDM5278067.1 ROK family transcriptional regulator [Paenibacillus silvae]